MAVGGGGLIAGIAAYVKRLWPETEVIGVEPVDADALSRSLEQGQRVELEQVGLFADGVAVRKVGEHTFELAQQFVDRMVRSTPMPSAPRSRTSLKTPVPSWSPPVPWQLPG